MAWKLDSDRPIYTQVVERLQTQIASGEYAPGARLPSVRDLATEAGINPNTMQRAFAELERKALVVTQRGSGRTVTEEAERIGAIRMELAAGQVRDFLERMAALGFEQAEIVALVEGGTND